MSALKNPPAFPGEQHECADGSWNQTFGPGMSLRDYFAAKALASAITSIEGAATKQSLLGHDIPADKLIEGAARLAYQIADAMLATRTGSAEQ